MIGLVIAIVLVSLLIIVLITPIVLTIDTPTKEYSLRWGRMAKAQVTEVPGDVRLLYRVGRIWKRDRSLLDMVFQPGKKDAQPNRSRRARSKSRRSSLKTVLSLIRSFRMRRCEINVDTGDFATNAYLYPVTSMLNSWRGRWRVNFNGDVEVHLLIDNSLWRVIRTLIRAKMRQ